MISCDNIARVFIASLFVHGYPNNQRPLYGDSILKYVFELLHLCHMLSLLSLLGLLRPWKMGDRDDKEAV